MSESIQGLSPAVAIVKFFGMMSSNGGGSLIGNANSVNHACYESRFRGRKLPAGSCKGPSVDAVADPVRPSVTPFTVGSSWETKDLANG